MHSAGPGDTEVTEVVGVDRTPSPCTTFWASDGGVAPSLACFPATSLHGQNTLTVHAVLLVKRPAGLHFKHQLEGLCPVCTCSFAQM